MNRKNIHIEKLQIRLPKGTSAAQARQIAAALGAEISGRIANRMPGKSGTRQIENLNAGSIENSGAASLPRHIARRIAAVLERSAER